MLVEREEQFREYGGYNPEFVKRARERRKAEKLAQLRRETERWKAQQERGERERRRRLLLSRVECLRDEHLPKPDAAKLEARTIIREIADKHQVPVEAIFGHSRAWGIVQVRKECIRAVHRARPDLTTTQLGRIFNRDHSTVIYALRGRRGK